MTHNTSVREDNTITEYTFMPKNIVLRSIIAFICGAVFSGLTLPHCGRFGGAMFVGAIGAGAEGFFALIGAFAGYLLQAKTDGIATYAAAALFIYTIAFLFQFTKIYKMRYFLPTVVSVVLIFVNAFGETIELNMDETVYWDYAFESIISFILTYFVRNIFSDSCKYVRQREMILGGILFLGVVINSLSFVIVYQSIILSSVAAMSIIMLLLSRYDLIICSWAAIILGMFLDLQLHSGRLFYYIICTAVCSFRNKRTFGSITIVFVGISMILVLFSDFDLDKYFVLESMISALLYWMFNWISWPIYVYDDDRQLPTGDGERLLLDYQSERFELMSDSLADIYDYMVGEIKTIEIEPIDMVRVFDRVGAELCENCEKRRVCWEHSAVDMLAIMDDGGKHIARRGKMLTSDLPNYFKEHCPYSCSFVSAVNCELRRILDEQRHALNTIERFESFEKMISLAVKATGAFSGQLSNRCLRNVEVERRLMLYLESIGLNCRVGVLAESPYRLIARFMGEEVCALTSRHCYLHELSNVIGKEMIISHISQDMLILCNIEPLAIEIGSVNKRKKGEDICGDGFRSFKHENGSLYVMLSDGVGNGEFAAEQSDTVIYLMERLLAITYDANAALILLNSILSNLSDVKWNYATLDLLEINLYTGKACFYKMGASDTVVYTSGKPSYVPGNVFSVGIASGGIDGMKVGECTLHGGDFIIMHSDGVVVPGANNMHKIIKEANGQAEVISRAILLSSENRTCDDDMTVLTITVELR